MTITTNEITYGVEIETVGKTRRVVAYAVARALHGSRATLGSFVSRDHNRVYDRYMVAGPDGRTWTVMRDGSITGGGAEIVSPILKGEGDMTMLQDVVRSVRKAGARVDSTCGIHVHVGANYFDPATLGNLYKAVARREHLIERSLGVTERRKQSWARPLRTDILEGVNARKFRSMEDWNRAWYRRDHVNSRPSHYDHSRYHGVNLHNVWFRGTVEFRWFDSTLHAGKVRAYVTLCLHLAAKALNAKSATAKRLEGSDRRTMRLFLNAIGIKDKAVRGHLLEAFPAVRTANTAPASEAPAAAPEGVSERWARTSYPSGGYRAAGAA